MGWALERCSSRIGQPKAIIEALRRSDENQVDTKISPGFEHITVVENDRT